MAFEHFKRNLPDVESVGPERPVSLSLPVIDRVHYFRRMWRAFVDIVVPPCHAHSLVRRNEELYRCFANRERYMNDPGIVHIFNIHICGRKSYLRTLTTRSRKSSSDIASLTLKAIVLVSKSGA